MVRTIFKKRHGKIRIALSILIVMTFLLPGTSIFSGNNIGQPQTQNLIQNGQSVIGNYTVTFVENGLPAVGVNNAPWAVTFNNTTKRSDGSSIVFMVHNGKYGFKIGNISGFSASPANGSITVNGSNYLKNIYFSSLYHTVSFYENGLPPATPWTLNLTNKSHNVSISKTSGNSTMSFMLENGIYSYSVSPSAGYKARISGGAVNVSNDNVKTVIVFVNHYNILYFNETGLPEVNGSLPHWSVHLKGVGNESSNGSSIVFEVPNGTYNFSIPSAGGYVSALPAKKIYLNSSIYSEPVLFVPDKHFIKFIEKGLPAGMSWGVKLNISSSYRYQFSDNNTVIFTVNGTLNSINYSVVQNPGFGLTANSSNEISFSSVNTVTIVNVTFSQSLKPTGVISKNTQNPYEIQFFEHGLPYGIQYTVTINTSKGNFTEGSGNGGLVTFIGDTNGSYLAWFSSQDGFIPVERSLLLKVVSNYTVYNVTYTPDHFGYFFNETGLPAGADWEVNINSYTYSAAFNSSATGSVNAVLTNGTYYYFVRPVVYQGKTYMPSSGTGFITVTGKQVNRTIYFYPTYVEKFFNETGLPAGSNWSLELNGISYYSDGTGTISVNLANGTYSYIIPLFDASYAPNDTSGVFYVSSTGVGRNSTLIHFHSITHSLTIYESNLPSGVPWEYDVDGITGFTSHNNVSLNVSNGSIQIILIPVNDSISGYVYYAIPSVFNFMLNNSTTERVSYNDFVYKINLIESNLPSGAIWSIYIDGTLYNSTPSNPTTITVTLPNGTYRYYIPHVDTNYWPSIGNGTFTVRGASRNITETFGINLYSADFIESGLSSSVQWNVTVYNTTASYSKSSYYSSIDFSLPNGTYEYTVKSLNSKYAPTSYSGVFIINGANVNEMITFMPVQYNITFIESGLPSGVTWTVDFAGTLYSNSTSSIVIQDNFNGSYSYSVTNITGYTVAPSSGTVTVNGSNVVVHIYFSSTSAKSVPPPPPSKSSGFHLPGYALIVIIAVVIVGALIGGVVIMQQQKKNKAK